MRIVASSGIPGIGVVPGFFFFFSSASDGIPGIGVVPFGPAFTGIPGVLGEIGTDFPESPGGLFAGSSFISEFTVARVFAFALTDEFAGAAPPHAVMNDMATATVDKIRVLNIHAAPLLK